jgi:hypothetical protein
MTIAMVNHKATPVLNDVDTPDPVSSVEYVPY